MQKINSRGYHYFFFFFVLFVFLYLPVPALSAAGWYVQPSAEVPLRRGQGKKYKIVAVVRDGTQVTLLKENNEWARIKLDSGREGWILKRYLSHNKPLQEQVSLLEQKSALLKEKLGRAESRLTDLSTAHHQTEKELTRCLADRDKARADFTQLQRDTADVISTKKELSLARKQLKDLNRQLTDLQLENTGLKKSSSLIWFLAGAGVLLMGWLIGVITGKRTKKRRGSLL